MQINGREVGFRYTVQAHIDSTEFAQKNPEAALARIYAMLAVTCSQSWARIHGGQALTEEEVLELDFDTFSKIRDEIDAQITTDSKTTVEAAEPKGKGKNAKSVAEKQS